MTTDYKVIERALKDLTIEQIREVDREMGQKHPDCHYYRYLCQRIIGEKQSEQVKSDFLEIIEAQKNAPSSATNTGQGKSNPTTNE